MGFLSVAQDLCIKGLTQDGQQQQQQHQQASTSSGPSTPASTPIKYAPPPAKRAKLKSNGDNIIKSSVPKKEPKIDPEIIEEVPPADQGDSLEGYEDYYEAGPSDPGEDGKGFEETIEDFNVVEEESFPQGGLAEMNDGSHLCTVCQKKFSRM